ncbi:MAG: MATE family efflux transporter [Symbiobacteriaceae bacterium]|nr:MATE family efflux transporter [Symbiobacteriaceae bacterium]
MTEGKPWRLIFNFTLPMLAGNVFQQLYNTVDAIIVGRYIGPNALAAVSTSFPVIFLLISFVFGLTMGSGIVISQFYGAGKIEQMRRATSTSLIFQMCCAAVMSVVGLLISEPLLHMMQVPPDIMVDSLAYMQIYFMGLVFVFAYNILAATLRSLGDSRTPLFFLIVSSILNIILDLFFIIVLQWGIAAVSWATVISQAIATLLCYFYIVRRIPLLAFGFHDLVFDKEILWSTIRIGLPSSTQQVVVSLGMMVVQGLVNGFGSITMAAYAAATRIDSFATMPMMNFGQALATYTGQNVGAWRIDRIKEGLKATLWMSLVTCIIMSLVVFTFGPNLISLFLSGDASSEVDPAELQAIITQGVDYVMTVTMFYIIFSLSAAINGLLRGAGDTMTPMVSSFLNLGLRVAVAYFLSGIPEIGYRGIWWSIPCGWAIGALVPLIRYLSGTWQQSARQRYEGMMLLTGKS